MAYGKNDGPGIEHENKPITLILEYITYVLQEPVEESNLLVNRYLLLIIFPPKNWLFIGTSWLAVDLNMKDKEGKFLRTYYVQ